MLRLRKFSIVVVVVVAEKKVKLVEGKNEASVSASMSRFLSNCDAANKKVDQYWSEVCGYT